MTGWKVVGGAGRLSAIAEVVGGLAVVGGLVALVVLRPWAPPHGPAPAGAPGAVDVYPVTGGYPVSPDFRLSVNGIAVPVSEFNPSGSRRGEYDIAQFAVVGAAAVVITTNTSIGDYSVSPRAAHIEAERDGAHLRLRLPAPHYLIVRVGSLPELVLAVDPPQTHRPAPNGPGVVNIVTDYRADPTGATPATAALQSAIDTAGQVGGAGSGGGSGGGVVYVPAGVFVIGPVRLHSNVTVYLAGGAVLRASTNPADYPVTFHKASLNLPGSWLISTDPGSHDITIAGRGTVDGAGELLRGRRGLLDELIMPIATTSFTVDGITGRDAGFWALTPTRSSNISIRDYKGFQSLRLAEDDAIDVNESQAVTLDNVLAISWDDSFSTKTWGPATDIAEHWPGQPEQVRSVHARGLLAWTACAAFKIGNGDAQPQTDITVDDSTVYDSSRAIAIDPRGGTGPISNARFVRLAIERVSRTNDGPRWLSITTGRGMGGAPIHDVLVSQIDLEQTGALPSRASGASPAASLDGLTFNAITVQGIPAGSLHDLHVTLGENTTNIHVH